MNLDALKSLSIPFDMKTGLSDQLDSIKRPLSAMKGMYADDDAYDALLAQEDVIVYEFYSVAVPEKPSDIAFGTSITYPGKVGDEYFMTKGHFHTILDTAETYYCLRGRGFMLMENPEGLWEAQALKPGLAVYVPARYAHRTINVSADEPLVTFYAFRADAGHNYGTIEEKGFRKLVVERDGEPAIVDNPKWQN